MPRRIAALLLFVLVILGGYLLWRHRQQSLQDTTGEIHCVGCETPKASTFKQDTGPTADTTMERKPRKDDQPTRPDPAPAAALPTRASTAAAPPTSDTLLTNSPDSTPFAGTGAYQWYRQGNLTWRVNTETGRSCIVFATLEEWRKQIVYSHGCGHNA